MDNFVSPFYQQEFHTPQSGTPWVTLPPGFIGNKDTETYFKFIQNEKDRKYKKWDVVYDDNLETEPGTRKLKKKIGTVIIDETENY